MKTAISLPDALYKAGDTLAKRLGVSRSELYARALADFVAKHKAAHLTQQLNAVYATESSELDSLIIAAQSQVLTDNGW